MQEKKIKVTYVLFQINKALGFEWVIDNLDKDKFELSFISIAAVENSPMEQFCKQRGIPFFKVGYKSKWSIPEAILKVYKILSAVKPNLVHCHIFEANIIGLTAAYFAGIKKRIYTRHHSNYHYLYAPSGRKYDLYCNIIATDIIAISKNVQSILTNKENVPKEKIHLVHHGFDLSFFHSIVESRIEAVSKKYNPSRKSPVIGVISRYTKWKGLKYSIEAFNELLKNYPDALLILANAKGEDTLKTKEYLRQLPDSSYVEIPFESDNAALFKLFDVFIHVPIDEYSEAFGQIYVEALATGIPSIFTLSGVASEFIVNRKNALVVDFKSTEQIYTSILTLLEDQPLRHQLIDNGKNDVNQLFCLTTMIKKLETIYSN